MNTYFKRSASLLSIITIFALLTPSAIVFAEESVVSVDTIISTDTSNGNDTNLNTESQSSSQNNTVSTVSPSSNTVVDTNELGSASLFQQPTAQSLQNQSINSLTSDPEPDPQMRGQQESKAKIQTDKANGILSYSYPVDVPEGRNKLTPELSLAYSSQTVNNDSSIGFGWEISIPYIKRVNRYGSDKLYDATTETFTSSLDGELVLVNATAHTYRPKKDDGSFRVYIYLNNSWSFIDKTGTTYSFGTTTQARQDDPNTPAHVYQWNLETVTDTHNNTITYTYFKDQGQIYPDKIIYAGIFEVAFIRSAYEMSAAMYHPAFQVKTNYRIDSIDIKTNGQLKKKYELSYVTGDAGFRQLLHSVTEKGYVSSIEIDLPSTTFTYKDRGTLGWTNGPGWELPTELYGDTNSPSNHIQIKDINGDAYPDVIYSRNDWNNTIPCNNQDTWINNTDGTWTHMNCFANQWTTPFFLKDDMWNYKDTGIRMFDYNGDGLIDAGKVNTLDAHSTIIQNPTLSNSFYNELYKNASSISTNWVPTSISSPIGFAFGNSAVGHDNGTQIVDFNGDGLVDIAWGWVEDDLGPPFVQTTSVTGDGSGTWTSVSPGQWELPWGIVDENPDGKEVSTFAQFVDVNGDGLVDYLFAHEWWFIGGRSGTNNGSTWFLDSIAVPPTESLDYLAQHRSDQGVRSFDINGDRLSDIASARINPVNNATSSLVILNTLEAHANAFSPNVPITIPVQFADTGDNTIGYTAIADLNADGMDDLVKAYLHDIGTMVSERETYLSQVSPYTDRLIGITSSTGIQTDITYKPSTQYKDASGALLNPHLPYIVDTVSTVTETDPSTGLSTKTEYTYSGGENFYANPHERQFAGFETVEEKIYNNVTQALLKSTKTYFHQGDVDTTMPVVNASLASLGESVDTKSKIGKVFRTELYDANNTLTTVDITKWNDTVISGDSHMVLPSQFVSRTFIGTTIDTATTYTYDVYGNKIEEKKYGKVTGANDGTFVDISGDTQKSNLTYVTNAAGKMRLLRSITVVNTSGSPESQVHYYYDGTTSNTSGGIGATLGNLTRVGIWVSGNSPNLVEAQTNHTYDTYGMVTSTTDPNGNTTTTTYDSAHLYPATITNPLGAVTTYVYDQTFGKPLSITAPNNFVTLYTYDAFGRVLNEKQTPASTVTALTPISIRDYVYTDTPGSLSMKVSTYQGATNIIDSYTYFDNHKRVIEKKDEAQATFGYNTTDTIYDVLGNVVSQTIPYQSMSASYGPVSSPSITYTYDVLGRVLSETHPVTGTVTTNYNGLASTITDSLGHKHVYTNDAYGNLIKVTEYIGTTPYNTSYVYDTSKNLTKVTDALGNIRTFTYDKRGLRLTATDLHAPADTTYGTYTYTYDSGGNLLTKLDPKNQITLYTYNALGQILTEGSNTSTTPVSITYTYDTCQNGIGRLCSVNRNGIKTDYLYDNRGNVLSEIKTIGPETFITSFTYDRINNPMKVTYPDQTEVTYNYTSGGTLSNVYYKLPGTTSSLPMVTSILYTPTNQPKTVTHGNSIITTSTYDAEYRLINVVSQKGTDPKVQDVSYTYDTVGNILTIKDITNTNTKKDATYVYDDLYRLTSTTVTNTASGTSPYTENYTYNILGNLMTKGGTQYTYTGVNLQNPHAPTTVGMTTLTYDDNGNITKDGTRTQSYTYRDEVSMLQTGSQMYRYTYDHTGERVRSEIMTSGLSLPTYTPNQYFIKDGAKVIKNIYAGPVLVGTIENTTPTFVLTDHLGSLEKATNLTGAITETTDYYPYGKERNHSGQNSKRRFLGEEYDVTGLNYLNARYYDGERGQFLSQDPVFWEIGQTKEGQSVLQNPQFQNSYSYAGGNPINKKDPSGRFLDTIVDAGFILYDLYKVGQAYATGGNVKEQAGYLGLDVAGAATPFATGFGVAARATAKVAKEANVAEKAVVQIAKDAKAVQNTLPDVIHLSGPIEDISSKITTHIEPRHIDLTQFLEKSKFNPDIDVAQLVRESTQHNKTLQANGNFNRTFDARRNVGVSRVTGQQTSMTTVITKMKNGVEHLISAYPKN